MSIGTGDLKNFKKRVAFTSLAAVAFIFTLISPLFAQGVAAIGEVRPAGKILIKSSDGDWMTFEGSYPLMQNTAIKTEAESAQVYFRDGSRLSLANRTEARIDGSQGHYEVDLTSGTLAFNIGPAAALSVATPKAVVYINKMELAQKVADVKPARALGIISISDKGTEVRGIAGRIVVDAGASGYKVVGAGESLLIDGPKAKVYRAEAAVDAPHVVNHPPLLSPPLIGAGVTVTTFGLGSWYGMERAGKKPASPYHP